MLPLESEDVHEVLASRDMMYSFVTAHNLKITKIFTSSGRSFVMFACAFPNIVFQHYVTSELYRKVCENCKLYPLIKVYRMFDDYQVIAFERVVTMHEIWVHVASSDAMLMRLVTDISELIYALQAHSLVHGDLTLDNIGYSRLARKFTVFDLETLKPATAENYNHDFASFDRSIKFWHELLDK